MKCETIIKETTGQKTRKMTYLFFFLDADAEEEGIFGAGTSKGGVNRKTGNMASMSGADDNLYTEFKKAKLGGNLHPLFKKFRARK